MDDSELTRARFLAEIGFLRDTVEQAGSRAAVVEPCADTPYPALAVELDAEPGEPSRQMVLSYYPVPEEEAGELKYLQYFAVLTEVSGTAAIERVVTLLPYVNARLILGHFGVSESPAVLTFRYVQALRDTTMPGVEDIADVLLLTQGAVRLFSGVLSDFAHGRVTLAEARSRVTALYRG